MGNRNQRPERWDWFRESSSVSEKAASTDGHLTACGSVLDPVSLLGAAAALPPSGAGDQPERLVFPLHSAPPTIQDPHRFRGMIGLKKGRMIKEMNTKQDEERGRSKRGWGLTCQALAFRIIFDYSRVTQIHCEA